MLTLAEHIAFVEGGGWPPNAYVKHPAFKSLYVRVADLYVWFDGKSYQCRKLIQIGNVEAKKRGQGAFTALVDEIIAQGFAVFVELAHEERFQKKLRALGFIPVNDTEDERSKNYLKGYEGHLTERT